jgi:hypothetical protein
LRDAIDGGRETTERLRDDIRIVNDPIRSGWIAIRSGQIDDQFHMVHAIVRPGRPIEFTVRVTRSLDCPDGGRP